MKFRFSEAQVEVSRKGILGMASLPLPLLHDVTLTALGCLIQH